MEYKYINDPERIEQVIRLFREYIQLQPEQKGKPVSFSNGYLLEQEGYKDGVYVKGIDTLNVGTWTKEKILNGKVAEMAENAMQISGNNFVNFNQKIRFKDKLDANPVKGGQILFDLYMDKCSDEESLEKMADFFGRRYDLISYLFYLKDPDTYVPCKPLYFQKAFVELQMEDYFFASCTYENYLAYNRALQELAAVFSAYGWHINIIDVHSFVYMISPNSGYNELWNYIFDDNGKVVRQSDDDTGKKEKKELVKVRLNQTLFRRKLIEYWNGKCSVTGCEKTDLLKASHIKPWRDCVKNSESVNVYNGLLLIPDLDAAFDAGYISFADDGRIMISGKLSEKDKSKLGIDPDMKLRKMNPEHQKFLKYHRENIFQK